MAVGRLFWQTPTGGILWEIWGRREINFAWHVAALFASLLCIQWILHGVSEVTGAVLTLVPLTCFLGSYLDLLTCFGYIEINARTVQIGYPCRLLLKPIGTVQLALVPMFCGGAVVVAVFFLWNQLILRPLGLNIPLDPLWLGAVLLSFFWWIQALAWGVPLFPGRPFITLLVAVTHLLVGLCPLTPLGNSACWRWLLLASMILTSVLFAITGLKWMRRGVWEGPSRLSALWRTSRTRRARLTPRRFGSPFLAQFWLEWRRWGLMLPGLAGGVVFAIVPLIFVTGKHLVEPSSGFEFERITLTLMLVVPLVLAGALGMAFGKMDPLLPTGEIPIYIGIRPMTNGGFVVAKLAMTLATSALTWLVTLAAGCFWLTLLGNGTLLSGASSLTPYGFTAFATGCIPALCLLILVTWKNLLAGMGVGLTGRIWVSMLFLFWRLTVGIGLLALIFEAAIDISLKETLLRWMSWILMVCLVSKIALSTAAFHLGLRRKAITGGAVGWIVGGWVVCGLFVAGYAGLVCHALNKLDIWSWIALAGFLALPLTDLAFAPLALAWNRHR
jgi:hypothetical protein